MTGWCVLVLIVTRHRQYVRVRDLFFLSVASSSIRSIIVIAIRNSKVRLKANNVLVSKPPSGSDGG